MCVKERRKKKNYHRKEKLQKYYFLWIFYKMILIFFFVVLNFYEGYDQQLFNGNYNDDNKRVLDLVIKLGLCKKV